MAVARAVLSAISRFVSAMAMLNFGGQQTVSTSVQNFVRMTLRRRSSVCSIPPRLQVLRPPIQPNHRLLDLLARGGARLLRGGAGLSFFGVSRRVRRKPRGQVFG